MFNISDGKVQEYKMFDRKRVRLVLFVFCFFLIINDNTTKKYPRFDI